MTTATLKVYGRNETGKGASHRVRDNNRVPGVVYGPKMKSPLPVEFTPNELLSVYKAAGKTSLITLEAVEGAPKELNGTKVLLKDLQKHPFKRKILHADLHQLDLSKKIRVVVPLSFTGKAKGVTDGGILNIAVRSFEIRCAPDKIPSSLEVDVTNLEIHGSLHIEEVEKAYEGKGYEFIYESNVTLATVSEPEDEVAATPVVDAAAAAAPGAPAAAGAAPAAGAAAPAAGGDKGGAKK